MFDVSVEMPAQVVGVTRAGAAVGVEFEDFVAARYDSLRRTAYLLTQDAALAEDLVQTVLAKCWLSWGRIKDPGAYVHRTLVNTYIAWWRRRWNNEHPTEELPESAHPGEDSLEDRADLGHALRRLPRKMRAVVVLRFYEDLSEAETAHLLNCSVGTVKSQTSRALAKLRIDPSLLASQGTLGTEGRPA